MKQCPKCGKEYGDDMLFCAECGEKLAEEQIRFCRNCGEKIRAGAAKCPKCGADLGVKKAETKKKKMPKAAVALAGGVFVLAAAAAVFVTGKKQEKSHVSDVVEYCTYMKDDNWYVYYADSDREVKTGTGQEPLVNQDGSRIFYDNGEGYIFYQNTTGKNQEEILIDTGVMEYAINDSGSEILYSKEDGNLYKMVIDKNKKEILLNWVEPEKNFDDVYLFEFIASEDLNRVLLMKRQEAGATYSIYDNKKHESKNIITTDYFEIPLAWDYGLTSFVLWPDDLYFYSENDGVVKKIEDGSSILDLFNYENNKIYWPKEINDDAMNFIEDDVTSEVSEQTEYYNKKIQLLKEIKNLSHIVRGNQIYFFDGNEKKILNDELPLLISKGAKNCPIVVGKGFIGDKIKLSEIVSVEEFEDKVNSNIKGFVFNNGNMNTISAIDSRAIILDISDNGDWVIYYKSNEDNAITMYKVSTNGISNPEVVFEGPEDQLGDVIYVDVSDKGLILNFNNNSIYRDGYWNNLSENLVAWHELSNGDMILVYEDAENVAIGSYNGTEIEKITDKIQKTGKMLYGKLYSGQNMSGGNMLFEKHRILEGYGTVYSAPMPTQN